MWNTEVSSGICHPCSVQGECVHDKEYTLNWEIFANSKFRELGSNVVGRKIRD